jgi:hypothetical protein
MQAMAAAVPLNLFGAGAPTPPAFTLTQAFNNEAVSADANTNPASFDGGGASFSAEALAGVGVKAGGTVNAAGLRFIWPSTAGTGQFDNAIADGQTIALSGTGNTLGLLFSAGYGPVTGTGSVRYTDGTTQPFTITSPDWFVTVQPDGGPSVAAVAPYQNRQGNTRFDAPAAVFAQAIPLTAGKTVASVTLPKTGPAPVQAGVPTLHIFAMTVGTRPATVSLRASNSMYVTADNAGASPLIANRSTVGTWEKFDVTYLSGDQIQLRSEANGLFVDAPSAGASALIANQKTAAGWETFHLVPNADGTSSIVAEANNKVVTSNNGTAPLIANQSAVGGWEKFTVAAV